MCTVHSEVAKCKLLGVLVVLGKSVFVRCEFSSEISDLGPDTVERVFGCTTSPDIISLSTKGPSPSTFPMGRVTRVSTGIFTRSPVSILRCDISRNCAPLEGRLARCVGGRRGANSSGSSVLVAANTRRVVSLYSGTLMGRNSIMVYRTPSFVNSLGAFEDCGTGLTNIPIRPSNVDARGLRRTLGTGPGTGLVCAVPGFRGPSNIAVDLRGHGGICRLTGGCNILVVRSGPCNSLHCDNRCIPGVGDFSASKVMVCTNSFSGMVSPNVHITCAVTPGPVFRGVIIYGRNGSMRAGV